MATGLPMQSRGAVVGGPSVFHLVRVIRQSCFQGLRCPKQEGSRQIHFRFCILQGDLGQRTPWGTQDTPGDTLGNTGHPGGTTFTQQNGFWAKLKTSKTHNSDYQNQQIKVFSASVRKTLGINQLYFHRKTVFAYHP